jgi:hypothetical protein
MAIFNIAIQENLPNALALVARRMEALLLGKPHRRVRDSNTEDPRDGSLVATQFRRAIGLTFLICSVEFCRELRLYAQTHNSLLKAFKRFPSKHG